MEKDLSKLTESELISLLTEGTISLCKCPIQTRDMCLAAVRKNGVQLQYVGDRTDEEVCLEAVKEYGFSLQFVPIPFMTENIKKAAVSQNGKAIRFIENPSEELCILAVEQTGDALAYIRNPSKEVCEIAVQNCYSGLEYIKKQDKEICKLALSHSPIGNILHCRFKINEPNFKVIKGKSKRNNLLCEKIDGTWLYSTEIHERMTKDEIIKHIEWLFGSLDEIYEGSDYHLWLQTINSLEGDFSA